MQVSIKKREFDVNDFQHADGHLEVKYGLPAKVEFCQRCVISNQRPTSAVEYSHTAASLKSTIHLDEHGICDACRVAEQKQRTIDWSERDRELRELCDRHRKTDGSYDCIVPGSGGKDSFYAAHMLKYKYGMNPLTITWAPHIYTEWGWRNLQAWIHAGFDNVLTTPNGRVHRLLTRLAVENLLHPFQAFIIGQKSLAPRLALLHKIPLVFYGENEAEYGNPLLDADKSRQDWRYFTSDDKSKIFLGGTSVEELQSSFGLTLNDLQAYMPADPDEIEKVGVSVHYMGYYLKWHPQSCYYYAVEHADFEASPERTAGTYSKYNSIDDRMDDFHYYTTFVKFGIGRATYDASQEVRSGDITRDEGVALVRKFDGEYPDRFDTELFKYLSLPPSEFPLASRRFESPIIDRDYFNDLCDTFRSPHLWKKVGNDWQLRHAVWHETPHSNGKA